MALETQGVLEKVMSNFQHIIESIGGRSIFDTADFITFLIIFIAGFIVSLFIKHMARKILDNLGVEDFIQSQGLGNALGRYRFTDIIENAGMWYFLLFILEMTTYSLQLGVITQLLSLAYTILPGLFYSIILLSVGLLAGEYLSREIMRYKFYFNDRVALVGKLFIIYLAVHFSALWLGFNFMIVDYAFQIVIIAVVIGLIIAFGYLIWYILTKPEENKKHSKT